MSATLSSALDGNVPQASHQQLSGEQKSFVSKLFCFTFNVFLFLWLEITFLRLWKCETAVHVASGIMTSNVVPHGRGETLGFFKTAYFGLSL
jgi:hypothetical protein